MLRLSNYFNHVEIGGGTSLIYNGASLCIDLASTNDVARWVENNDFSFLSAAEIHHALERGHITENSLDDEFLSFRSQVAGLIDRNQAPSNRHKRGTLSGLSQRFQRRISCLSSRADSEAIAMVESAVTRGVFSNRLRLKICRIS